MSEYKVFKKWDKAILDKHKKVKNPPKGYHRIKVHLVFAVKFCRILGLTTLNSLFNTSTGWFGRFVLSTEWSRTRKLEYNDLNWPRCSAQVTESLALTDGGFCQKQTLDILDYVKFVSL